jgi:hypothetical protein
MTSVVVAVSLGILTLLRLSGLWNRPARPAFLASAFATAGFTLCIEPIYIFVDSLTGNRNLAGLILSLCVLAAFAQLYTAVTNAAGLPSGRQNLSKERRHQVAWIASSLIVVGGFSISDLPVTNPSLIRTYGSQPGMTAFLLAASFFITYTSVSVIRSVIGYLSQMSAAFRLGFFLVCAGCFGAISLLAVRSVLQLVTDHAGQESFSPFYGTGQAISVVCVAAGLSTSRLVGITAATSADLSARWRLLRLVPLWKAATASNPNLVLHQGGSPYKDALSSNPPAALQRRITEVRDCLLVDPIGLEEVWTRHGAVLLDAEKSLKTPSTPSSPDRTAV